MVFLNYVRLLFFASLCAASLRSAATRELANEIRLQFHLWSNSTAVCDAVLSSPGAVSVAVSYRTDLDSDNWIPLESSITIQTPVVSSTLSSCVNRSARQLLPSDVAEARVVQFRFLQVEHGGGYCSCWGISDLAVYNGTARLTNGFTNDSDMFCNDAEATLDGCDGRSLHVLCAGSASVARSVLSRPFTLSPSTPDEETMLNCSDDQLVEPSSPLCDSASPNTSYISVSFQLNLNLSYYDCNALDNLDEGIELAVRSSTTDSWVPLMFYGLDSETDRTKHLVAAGLGLVDSNVSMVTLRGYSVPIRLLTSTAAAQNIAAVQVCGREFLESGVQFRWLQTVRVKEPERDMWTLDNVTVAVNYNGSMRQVLFEDFETDSLNNFSVKAGSVADGVCGLSGHSLVFGTSQPIADFESRIGVTPPLDLRPCAEESKPACQPTMSSSLPPTTSPPPPSSSSSPSSPSPSLSSLPSSSPLSPSPSPSPSSPSLSLSSLPSSSPLSPSPSPSPSSPSLSLSSLPSSSPLSPSPSPSPSSPSLSLSSLPSSSSLSPSLSSLFPSPSSSLPSPSPSPIPSTVEEETQQLIDSDPDYSRIQNLPPNEAIQELAQLASPDGEREDVDETVVVYLMADILSKIETNISREFSQNFILAGSNIIERVISREEGEEPNTIAGSSLLNVMDQFALNAGSSLLNGNPLNSADRRFLNTDNIDLSVQVEDDEVQVENTEDNEEEEILGIGRDDSRIVLPRELIRNINMTMPRRGGGRRVQIGSFLFNNLTGLLPNTLPGMDSNSTNTSRLAGPILSSALQCNRRICNTRNIMLRRPVRIVITHSGSMRESEESVCVFWEFEPSQSGRLVGGNWATEGCYRNENLSNNSVTVCECNHLTHFAILLSPGPVAEDPGVRLSLQIIGIIGVTVSLVAMTITILTFICLRALWSMRNYIHINLCISLMAAQLTFIAGVEPRGSVVGCQVVAVLLHYLFMVTFMWMLMEGVVLYVALVQVFTKHQARYIAAFTIVSYGLPLLYMGVTIPLGFLVGKAPHYGYEAACWLRYDTNFIWAFTAPVIIIALVNVGFFIMAITIMYRHHRRQTRKSRVAEVKYWLISSVSLLVVMGITWVIGIFTFGTEALLPVAYIFTIFIGFQGAIIFFLFVVMSKQVREAYGKWWKVKVTESELLSKYFGERLTTTTSTTTGGRSSSISSSDYGKLKSAGSMVDKKKTIPEEEKVPPIALQTIPQGNVFNIVFLPRATAETVALENGGLERHEKTAVENEYMDTAQLQAAAHKESSDTSQATIHEESSVSEYMDASQATIRKESSVSEYMDTSQATIRKDSSVSELMDTAQLLQAAMDRDSADQDSSELQTTASHTKESTALEHCSSSP